MSGISGYADLAYEDRHPRESRLGSRPHLYMDRTYSPRLHSAAVHDIVPRRRGGRKNPGETVAMMHRLLVALTALAGLVLACPAASAHPHVWVTVKSELVYAPDGSVTGVRHAWTFDDMFSVFATQGIEAKKKSQFTRGE